MIHHFPALFNRYCQKGTAQGQTAKKHRRGGGGAGGFVLQVLLHCVGSSRGVGGDGHGDFHVVLLGELCHPLHKGFVGSLVLTDGLIQVVNKHIGTIPKRGQQGDY